MHHTSEPAGTTAQDICLTVISDDLGFHPAINEGIVDSFINGVLTDTNLMAPCPAFDEGVALAREHSVPVGFHTVFTCDFDQYLWKPLTQMKTMVTAEGHFRPKHRDAWSDADYTEARNELDAQYTKIVATGLPVTHITEHMGTGSVPGYGQMIAKFADEKDLGHKLMVPESILEGPYLKFQFQTVIKLSEYSTNYAERKRKLIEYLHKLKPGYSAWITHAAVDSPSLDKLCSDNHPSRNWARIYRVLDYRLMKDLEVQDCISRLNIRLTPVAQVPKKKSLGGFDLLN